jgi:hypothetical protein
LQVKKAKAQRHQKGPYRLPIILQTRKKKTPPAALTQEEKKT